MLRRKYLITKQEKVISSLKKETCRLKLKIPEYKKKWESMIKVDEKEDEEFSVWADAVEEYNDKLEEIELAEEFLLELQKRI